MILIVFSFFMFSVFADENPPTKEDLEVLEKEIPLLIAQNAEIQSHITRVETSSGPNSKNSFLYAFPKYANQPLLSRTYVQGILFQLQKDEIALLQHVDVPSCPNCSEEIQKTLSDLYQQNIEYQRKYQTLQRQYIMQLYANLSSLSQFSVEDLNQTQKQWNAYFDVLDKKIASSEDTSSQTYIALQQEHLFVGQHIGHLQQLQILLVDSLSMNEKDKLYDWFFSILQVYKDVKNTSSNQALLELFQYQQILLSNSIVMQNEESWKTLQQNITTSLEQYQQERKEIENSYQKQLDEISTLPIKEKQIQLEHLKNKINNDMQGRFWLETEYHLLLQKISTAELNAQNVIEKEMLLEQEEYAQEVVQAQKDLEEAKQQRQKVEEQVISKIQDEIIRIRESIQNTRSLSQQNRLWTQEHLQKYDVVIQSAKEQFTVTSKQSSFNPTRQKVLDNLYLDVDNQINQIREDIVHLEEKKITIQVNSSLDLTKIDTQLYTEDLQNLVNAEHDFTTAIHDAHIAHQQEIFEFFIRLETCKNLRRTLLYYASDSAIFLAKSDLWFELQAEFNEQPKPFLFWWNTTRQNIQVLPSKLLHLDYLYKMASKLFHFLIIGFIWLGLRKYGIAIYNLFVQWRKDPLHEQNENIESFATSSTYLIDSVFAIVIYYQVQETYPTLTLGILILQGYLLKKWYALFDNTTSTSERNWESNSKQILQKGLQTILLMTFLFYIHLLSYYITTTVMSADRFGELVEFVLLFLFVLVLLKDISEWGNICKEDAQNWIKKHQRIQWFEGWLSYAVLQKILWSCTVFILFMNKQYHILSLKFIANTGLFTSALANNDGVYQISKESIEKATKAFPEHDLLFQIEQNIQKIKHYIEQWKKDPTIGIMAIIGDYGSGKTSLLTKVTDASIETKFLTTNMRIVDKIHLQQWLREEFQISVDNIIDTLNSQSPKIILVDNLHFFFLRKIEGYEALYEFTRIMQETSRKHCWITSIHLHAWNFLHSTAAPFETNLFHPILHIGNIDIPSCISWSTACVKEQDIDIDFSKFNENYKIEDLQEDIKTSYWKFLLDRAQKNPIYVRELWIQSLEYSCENNKEIFYVHFFQPEPNDDIQNLDLIEYFIFSTLVIHRNMTVQDQSAALNIELSLITYHCNNLKFKNYLKQKGDMYAIQNEYYPTIILLLQQKRMLVSS